MCIHSNLDIIVKLHFYHLERFLYRRISYSISVFKNKQSVYS
jgi:hypothetical protein